MKHCILLPLLFLSSLLGAQGVDPGKMVDTTGKPTIVCDTLMPANGGPGAIAVSSGIACEWQSPATSSTAELITTNSPAEADIISDFRIEYSDGPLDTFAEYLGSGTISDSITWSGPINTWEPYTSRLHLGSSATYYTVVISNFLKVEEVRDSAGVSYHFQCEEKVSNIIH